MAASETPPSGVPSTCSRIVDNSAVDEALAGTAPTFGRDRRRRGHRDPDDGRGIPADIHPTEGVSAARWCSPSPRRRQVRRRTRTRSPAACGVGASVVNALSESLEVEIWRDGHVHIQRYCPRHPATLPSIGNTGRRGTRSPSPARNDFDDRRPTSAVEQRLRGQPARAPAFRNRAPLIEDKRSGREHEFHAGRHRVFVEHLNSTKTPVHADVRSTSRASDGSDHRGRDTVERRLLRDALLVREQHQHARGRHPPLGIPAPR